MSELSQRLRLVRESLLLSQRALAEQCGINQRTQRSYEAGEHMPDASYLIELSRQGGDVMYVLLGQRENAPIDMPSVPLTSDEVALIQKYRSVSVDLRLAAHRVVEGSNDSATPKPRKIRLSSKNSKNNIQIGVAGGSVKIGRGK